ncbi:DUF6299 family protein [Yinghuangia seranimata]|uniref:DUF6299 family protein n=1 Tax=Yinghuangia seranimata TaxID=408067 RepID=UPI00248C9ED2|nr:DUF6299 family protein [Yinghuangia seranimata]MDI2125546.1 DUF6299 family protein [Yinghuangia seranimata]
MSTAPRRAALLIAAGIAAASTLATPSANAAGADSVSLDGTGYAAADGTVSVSGTYQCAPTHTGLVLVGARLERRNGTGAGIGGTHAICDGAPHTWTNTDHVEGFAPGTVQGEASMVELTHSGFLVMPEVVAADHGPVALTGG